MRAAGALGLAALLLAGCDRAPPAPEQSARVPANSSAIEGPPKQARSAGLRLAGDGIRPDLTFGASEADVVAAATKTLGAASGTDRIDECGEGPMEFVRFGGLSLGFQEGRFVGWFARAPFTRRTSEGLAVGDPRSKVSVVIEESTLGQEFRTPDGISGLLGDDGKSIDALWAGSACLFR